MQQEKNLNTVQRPVLLIVSRDIITTSYESLTKHIKTLSRENAGLLKCTAGGTFKFITTVL